MAAKAVVEKRVRLVHPQNEAEGARSRVRFAAVRQAFLADAHLVCALACHAGIPMPGAGSVEENTLADVLRRLPFRGAY